METCTRKCLYSIWSLDHMETWPYKCLYSIRSLDYMETWPYKCLYSIRSLDYMETWPYKCLYSIPPLDHMETWPYKCLYSICLLDHLPTWPHKCLYSLSHRPIICKPGHTNVCILFDRSIIWKPGHTNVCILFDRSIIRKLAIQMPVFYPTTWSSGNLAIQMSVFYLFARSSANLATQMSVQSIPSPDHLPTWPHKCLYSLSHHPIICQPGHTNVCTVYPIARSSANLATQMSVQSIPSPDHLPTWPHKCLYSLSHRPIICKPGHHVCYKLNACILSDRSIISKRGQTNVRMLSDCWLAALEVQAIYRSDRWIAGLCRPAMTRSLANIWKSVLILPVLGMTRILIMLLFFFAGTKRSLECNHHVQPRMPRLEDCGFSSFLKSLRLFYESKIKKL